MAKKQRKQGLNERLTRSRDEVGEKQGPIEIIFH